MTAEMLRKTIVSTIKEVKGKERVLEFIGTTELIDRDNEVIKADAWQFERYKANPVVQWAHIYSAPPIGKTVAIRQTKKRETVFEIEFADYEYADIIFKLCKGGFLNATSVGFIPLEYEEGKKAGDPRRIYTKVELLEISIVPVPSNPDALISARNAGVITVKEFNALTQDITKAEVISQAAGKEFNQVTKPEETEDYYRVPVPGEGGDKHSEHRIRTITISEKQGIKALYCGEDKVVITYLFSKEEKYGWTMAKAEAWVKEHEKSYRPRLNTQEELRDELDYVIDIIKTGDLNAENKKLAGELYKTLDFNEEFRQGTLRQECWNMMDCLAMCLYRTMDADLTAEEKVKDLNAAVSAFHKAFKAWIEAALAAGIIDNGHQDDRNISPVVDAYAGFVKSALRISGSDIPVEIKTSDIRSAIEPVIEALSQNHEAHNKCHDMVMKALDEICQEGDKSGGREESEAISELAAQRLIQETINEIMKRRKINAYNT